MAIRDDEPMAIGKYFLVAGLCLCLGASIGAAMMSDAAAGSHKKASGAAKDIGEGMHVDGKPDPSKATTTVDGLEPARVPPQPAPVRGPIPPKQAADEAVTGTITPSGKIKE